MGALAAVERYMNMDHTAREQYCEDCVQLWCAALNPLAGVYAERDFPNEAGQPLPWCSVKVDPELLGKTAEDLADDFFQHDPPIAVHPDDDHHFYLNPMTLTPGEETIVRDACLSLLKP